MANVRTSSPVFEKFAHMLAGSLLMGGAAFYNGILYGYIKTGEYRFLIHRDSFVIGPDDVFGDFVLEIVLGAISGLVLLLIARRFTGLPFLSFLPAAFAALYMGMPDVRLFGNTWEPGEPTNELFLQHYHLVVPISLAIAIAYSMFLWCGRKLLLLYDNERSPSASGDQKRETEEIWGEE